MQWTADHRDIISILASIGTLLVWVIRSHLFTGS